MKALSIKPPWAYYIIYGISYGVSVDLGDGRSRVEDSGKVILKDIENRKRPTSYRGRIYIHVSQKEDPIEPVMDFCCGKLGIPYGSILMSYSKRLPRGCIIGEIDIIDCVTESKNPWFTGKYGFVLANPKMYKVPINCRGKLGFWTPDILVQAEVKKANEK